MPMVREAVAMRRRASARRSVPRPIPAWLRLTARRPMTAMGMASGAWRAEAAA